MNDDTCPGCDGPGIPLGVLGYTRHFRCQNCGLEFSIEVNPREKGDDDGIEYGDPRDHKDGLE